MYSSVFVTGLLILLLIEILGVLTLSVYGKLSLISEKNEKRDKVYPVMQHLPKIFITSKAMVALFSYTGRIKLGGIFFLSISAPLNCYCSVALHTVDSTFLTFS